MGAWGHGSFDNDDAADFVIEVTDGDDLAPVRAIFATVLGADDDLEAPDASQAIAAAEIVAAALGRATPAAAQQEDLVAWLARTGPAVDAALVAEAVQVLDRIVGEHSELADLWDEVGRRAAWMSVVAALRSALQG